PGGRGARPRHVESAHLARQVRALGGGILAEPPATLGGGAHPSRDVIAADRLQPAARGPLASWYAHVSPGVLARLLGPHASARTADIAG
ncbi:MAG: hypothetical protein ACXVFM_07535, partial [Solirubrobacteraceae bacterium]